MASVTPTLPVAISRVSPGPGRAGLRLRRLLPRNPPLCPVRDRPIWHGSGTPAPTEHPPLRKGYGSAVTATQEQRITDLESETFRVGLWSLLPLEKRWQIYSRRPWPLPEPW